MGRTKTLFILLLFPISLLITAFIVDDWHNIVRGLWNIIIRPDLLLIDYLVIGGIGATFLNASLIVLMNIFILYKLQLKINGTLIAALFTIAGFSFFGKNVLNIWPIYIGGFLYVRYQKMTFREVILIMMFGTSLSPIVSQIMFGFGLPYIFGLPLGIGAGILIGFILPPLSSHMLRFHDGYNIYNIGFTAGVLGSILTAVLRGFGFIIETQYILSSEYDLFLKLYLCVFFILLILVGYNINGNSFRGYGRFFSYSGRLVTDYVQLLGIGVTFINMGIMGLIAIGFVICIGGVVNGPIVGGILTIVGFSAFGKHPKNAIPIMLGVVLGGLLKTWELSATEVILAGLFGTTLAPVAGTYGIAAGIATGFLHLSLVMNIGVLHGGINLYNNGFSGGIIAAFVVPLIEAFKRGDETL